MSKVHVRHEHTLNIDDSRSRIEYFESFMGKYGAKLVWSGNHAELKGPGVSGGVDLADQVVNVTVKLGMLARAAGVDPNRLEGSIRKRLVAAFHPDGPQVV